MTALSYISILESPASRYSIAEGEEAHGPAANILNECRLSLDFLQEEGRTRAAAPAAREARCPKTAAHKERPLSSGAGPPRIAAENHSETTRIQHVSAGSMCFRTIILIKYKAYLNNCSISSWQIGLIPFSVRTRIAFSLSATRNTMKALFAFLARNA